MKKPTFYKAIKHEEIEMSEELRDYFLESILYVDGFTEDVKNYGIGDVEQAIEIIEDNFDTEDEEEKVILSELKSLLAWLNEHSVEIVVL